MRLTSLLAIIAGLAILGMIFAPVFACGCSTKASARSTACLSNVKQQSLGMIQYSTDNADRFPPRDFWMDSIRPYVTAETIFHDPELSKESYGYAFNAALSLAKPPKNPESVPMIYESVNPIRNASDRVTSLPLAGRRGGRVAVGYADGHVRRRLVAEVRP